MTVLTRPRPAGKYVSGGEEVIPIPRQHFLQRIRFHAKLGTFTGGATGNPVTGAANKMVKLIQLTIGGQLTIFNASFENLRRLNLLRYRDTLPADGYAFLDLPLLPTHLFTALDLRLVYANASSLNDGDHTDMTGATVGLQLREVINEGQDPANVPLIVTKTISKGMDEVTGEIPVDIRDGNTIQAVLVVPSDPTLINHVSVLQDGVKHHRKEENYDELREENKADFELDAAQTDFAVINFDAFGDGSQSLNTAAMDTLELIFDVDSVADGKVELVLVEVQAQA